MTTDHKYIDELTEPLKDEVGAYNHRCSMLLVLTRLWKLMEDDGASWGQRVRDSPECIEHSNTAGCE